MMASTAPTDRSNSFDIAHEDQRGSQSKNSKPHAIILAFLLGMLVATIAVLTLQHIGLGDASVTKKSFLPQLPGMQRVPSATGTWIGARMSNNKGNHLGRTSRASIHQPIPTSLSAVPFVRPIEPQSSPWLLSTTLSLASPLLIVIIGGLIFLRQRRQTGIVGSMGSDGGPMGMVPSPRTFHRAHGAIPRSDVPMMSVSSPSSKRVVLVTGANKGIGKEIARKLGSLESHVVVLGCRDEQLGKRAADELRAAGCDAVFSRLDLIDSSTIEATRNFIEHEFGRLDVLVNNAAICFNDPTLYGKVEYTPFEKQANITVQTNYFGTLGVTQAMLPLLRASQSSPRIVNVASAAGRLRGSQELQDKFTSSELDVPQLSSLMNEFVHDAEAGMHTERGWPNTCYGVAKMGLIALTRVLSREEPSILVSSVDPGYCATDQNQNQGYISAWQGAVTPALLSHGQFTDGQIVSGKHFYEGREIPWSY